MRLNAMSERCIFCRITRGDAPAHMVYRDGRALAFLDIHPSAPGHTIIIPRAHAARVEDLSQEDAAALFRALHLLVGRIQAAVDAPASTIGINNGHESGQEIPHVHIHVIPRALGDRGGIIQGIARPPRRLNEEEMMEIADKIRQSASNIALDR